MFKNHPKGLLAAAISNMGERFGYYIMNAVLVLFLCSKFGLSDETSSIIYSVFYCGIYVLSLVGGIIADRTQNYKGTIMSGLIVMSLGYVILSIPVLSTAENIGWLLPLTGYIRGGCTPIGMKKTFSTYIHESCLNYPYIYISAGQRGLQLKLDPNDLIKEVHAEVCILFHD